MERYDGDTPSGVLIPCDTNEVVRLRRSGCRVVPRAEAQERLNKARLAEQKKARGKPAAAKK